MPYYLALKLFIYLFFLENYEFYLHALLTERILNLNQTEICNCSFRFMCMSGDR